jgi:ABC-type tungstate transport system permease subunit
VITLSQRRAFIALLALTLAPACKADGPRALILADASGHASAMDVDVDARASSFEKQRGRSVRVLRIESGEAALELAARGEVDAAVIPESVSIDRFLAAKQGTEAGVIETGGARLRVLTMNPKQLPKVDPEGADLAAFLVKAP